MTMTKRTTHKWWLYSGTALALLSWSLGETSAQADTQESTATAESVTTTGNSLQESTATLSQPTTTTDDTVTGTDQTPTNGANQASEPTDATPPVTDTDSDTDLETETPPVTDQSTTQETAETVPPVETGTNQEKDDPEVEETESTLNTESTKSPVTTDDQLTGTKTDGDQAAPATVSAPTPQKRSASPELDPDADLSDQFKDANLLAAVRKSLNLTADQALTLKDIQNFLGVAQVKANGFGKVTDLSGLELLGNLPEKAKVSVEMTLGNSLAEIPNLDLTPLLALKNLTQLSIKTNYWGAMTDDQLHVLTQADVHYTQNLDFSSEDNAQKNLTGMTSH